MKILYFSWIKDKIGINEENIDIDQEVDTVKKLIFFLRNKGENYNSALENTGIIRFSINMKNAKLDDKIKNVDEIAFFPPMTGG
tara:strand:- start:251 stop:502 length:252 start_codon:yes stop_codon:yes gene_type:complete